MAEDAGAPAATVLVAEDDPDIRALFSTVLEAAGAAVVGVNSGAEALETLRNQTFDLVVTDMWMPDVSGLDLCKALRADPATAKLPILMVSAYGRMRGREEAMMVGATEYVTKPMPPERPGGQGRRPARRPPGDAEPIKGRRATRTVSDLAVLPPGPGGHGRVGVDDAEAVEAVELRATLAERVELRRTAFLRVGLQRGRRAGVLGGRAVQDVLDLPGLQRRSPVRAACCRAR